MLHLGVRVVRRTGEHKDRHQARPRVILTTPESFDSALCRGKLSEPDGHTLAQVSAVVFDEIHLVHGNARGEQLRWLLERLRRLRSQAMRRGWSRSDGLQVIALSATVPDPEAVITRYMPGGAIVSAAGSRAIECVVPPSEYGHRSGTCCLCIWRIRRTHGRSSSSRTRVARSMNWPRSFDRPWKELGISVRAHHGSLAQGVREEAEECLRRDERSVVVRDVDARDWHRHRRHRPDRSGWSGPRRSCVAPAYRAWQPPSQCYASNAVR